jgi:predicted transcriptional regulator
MTEGEKMIKRLLSSEAKAELLRLFHRNPGLIDTIDGVARRIGRKASAIEKDVADLVELNVLEMKRIGPAEVILFDRGRDKEIQSIVASDIGSKDGSGG